MATTPTWQAATSGQPALAGHVNQFLGTHGSTILYDAVQQAGNTTTGSTSTNSNGIYIAQSFTTGASQTAIGYIIAPIDSPTTSSGSVLAPTTLSLYANSAGAPTGSALVSVTVTAEYAYIAGGSGGSDTRVVFPLPITGLTANTQYWLVLAPAGNSTNHFTWFQSTAGSGASTSTNGTTWTTQAYGLRYQVFDQTASGLLKCIWDDAGARWLAFTRNSVSNIQLYPEYTAGQTTAGYVQSVRNLSYTNGLLTGVA